MNSFPQIYNKLTESERELCSIRYLCLDEPKCALISLSSLELKTIEKIIMNLLHSRPPYKELFNSHQLISTPIFHWICICISKSFGINPQYNIIPLLLQILRDDKLFSPISKILEILGKIYNNQIPFSINSKNDPSFLTKNFSSLTTKEFDAIISLSISYPQLFRAFSPFFEIILNIVDINNFYHQYGYTLLSIMNIESLNIKSVIFNDYPELEVIIQKTLFNHFYYNNFDHSYQFFNKSVPSEINSQTTFLYQLQNNFFLSNPFPSKTFFGGYSILYSLLNTSLAKQEHFIDITKQLCFKLFQQNDFENGLDSFSLIPQMKSWAAVAIYDKEEYRNNLAFLPEILPLLPQDLKPNISTEFLIRSNNDNQFKIRLIQMTGQKSVNLTTKSIPSLFIQCLNPKNSIFEYENIYDTPLLSYTDEERIKDCDFISYYFAIINEIKCITDEEKLDDHIYNLSQSLSLFSSQYEKHNSIMIDLFSLLFLQVDGQFICSSDAANRILPLLSSYIISDSFLKIFTKNLKKANIANILFENNHNLNNAFLPFSSLFDLTLTSHDWGLAKQLEGNDKKLKMKRQIFNETYNFSQTNKTNIDDENSALSFIVSSEIGLSYENQTDYLNSAKKKIELSQTDDNVSDQPNKENAYYLPINELKNVLLNRKPHPLQFPSCNQEFFMLSEKLQKITSTQWEKTNISNDYQDCSLFCGFYSYLDGFIPVIFDSNYAKTVVDALLIKPDKLIFGLYSQNKMKEVNQVADALKMDVFESLILQSNKTTEMKLPFIKEYPIINFTESFFTDDNIDSDNGMTIDQILNDDYDKLSSEYTFNSKLFKKLKEMKNTTFYDYLINHKKNKNKIVNEIDLMTYEKTDDLFYVNNVPTNYYEKVLTDLIQEAAANKTSFDVERVSELSFSVSIEFFEGLIQKNIQKLNLNDLKNLIEISNCSESISESIEILVKVSKDFQPVFPLENSFRHLLSTGSFKLASDFCRVFRYQMKASKVLREISISLLKQSKTIKYVLNVCPQLKNEIIESIPPSYKEKAIQDADIFFDIIPQKWERHKDPKMTFILNLNDDENAYSIFQKMPNFKVDHELLLLFQTPADIKKSEISKIEVIKMLSISLAKLLKYFRNPYEPCQKILNYLINIVSKIVVDENEDELDISVLMHRIHSSFIEITQIINTFFLSCSSKSPQNQKRNQQFSRFLSSIPLITKYIGVLSNFTMCQLSTKYGLTYSFKEFQSKEKATEFMKICFKYDIPTIAIQFMDTWGLSDQSTLVDDYALILFKLGRFDDGLKMCINRRMKKSLRTMSIVNSFVDQCSYSQLFDQNNIDKMIKIDKTMLSKFSNNNDDKIPNNELFDFITNHLQVNGKTLINNSVWNYIQHNVENINDPDNSSSSEQFVFMPMKTTEESLRAANRYLKLKAPLFMRVKKLVINGNFDKALKLAMNNNNKKIDANNNSITFNLDTTNKNQITRTMSEKNSNSTKTRNIIQGNNTISRTNSQNSSSTDKKIPSYSDITSDDISINDINNSKNDEINIDDTDAIFMKNKNDNKSNDNNTNTNGILNINKDNNNNKNRNIKIAFSTENVSIGSPKKTYIASINGKQRMMQERFNLFLENIFVMSISYSNFSKMKVKLLEFDPTLHFFGSLVEKLLQFSMNNDMPRLKFELELFLGRTDSAALTSISLFNETKSINDLEKALKAIKKDLLNRKQNTKIAPNTMSVHELELYEKIIPLQIKFMKFIQNNSNKFDLEYNRSLSLFNGKKSAISTVIVLFRNFNFSLALEIIITCELDLIKIADDLCDMIYNERNSSMLKMIRSLEDSFPDEIFMKIINQILLRLFYVINDDGDLAFRIIENGLNNEDFRTKLYIQFGQYEKAFENAKKWKLFNLMPLIAHEALSKDPGNQSIQIASSITNMLTRIQRSTSLDF